MLLNTITATSISAKTKQILQKIQPRTSIVRTIFTRPLKNCPSSNSSRNQSESFSTSSAKSSGSKNSQPNESSQPSTICHATFISYLMALWHAPSESLTKSQAQPFASLKKACASATCQLNRKQCTCSHKSQQTMSSSQSFKGMNSSTCLQSGNRKLHFLLAIESKET